MGQTAHKTQNTVGNGVQEQVEDLATATKTVAETLHNVHQRRVDGLNDGVSTKFKKVETAVKTSMDNIRDDITAKNIETGKAIDRNNVRTHALAQDIVDRHGDYQFTKHNVSTKFYDEAQNESKGTTYWTEAKDKETYIKDKFPQARRRLASRPKSHTTVLEALLEEINRLN